jgi:hypothetical protein
MKIMKNVLLSYTDEYMKMLEEKTGEKRSKYELKKENFFLQFNKRFESFKAKDI